MSKRQRDSLIAEVEKHRQQQQQQQQQHQGDTQSLLSFPTKTRQDRSPQLLQPMASPYPFSGEAELLSYTADVHPYLVCSPSDSQVSGMIYRGSSVSPTSRSHGRGDSGHPEVRGEALMCDHTILVYIPPPHPLLSSSYLSPFFMSGFDSRQPSHDLMAIHPYSTLEDPYTVYPHALRNIGE